MATTPIFLFSLPRSGSTLLQRLLATHRAVHTTSEPWLLLPLMFTLKDTGVRSVYGHRWLRTGLDDFIRGLPAGRADYLDALAGLGRDLYTRASPPGTRYFLDKTPRYHLIVDEIAAAFPDAPLIFLWRHPLAVAASVIGTWARPPGHWNLFRARIDLYAGLDNLVRGYERHGARAIGVNYETLVRAPEPTLARLFAHLDLEALGDAVARLAATRLPGRLGDHAGTARYALPSPDSCDAWTRTLGNPFRRQWCRRYLEWIGPERLARMGYDAAAIAAEIDAMPGTWRYLASDCVRAGFGWLNDRLDLDLDRFGLIARGG